MGLHRVLVQAQALHSYGLASMIFRCCSTLVLLELVPAPMLSLWAVVSSCSAIGIGDEAFRTAIFLHWHDLRALAGCLQIALSAIVALASALATHRQPPKCAALSSHASASFCNLSYLLTNGEDRYLFAALKTVPSICQPTYASEFSSFLPS